MDKIITELKANLEDGERILWSGSPKNVRLLDEGSRLGCIIRWCVCAAVFIASMLYVLMFDRLAGGSRNLIGVVGLASIAVAFLPMLNTRRLRNRVFYFVTNRRVIACRRAVPLKIQSQYISDIAAMSSESMENGMSIVYFGEKSPSVTRSARLNLAGEMPRNEDGSPRFPVVFWSTDDPDGAIEAVRACLGCKLA